jgi:hypothetical protein
MTDALDRLIMREAGGGGGGRGRRMRGPRKRASYVAHVAAWWPPETVAEHLAGCRTGRDAAGEWRPHEELSDGERWCWFWEYSVVECGIVVGGGPAREVEVS